MKKIREGLEILYDIGYATAENQEEYFTEEEAINQAKQALKELMLEAIKEDYNIYCVNGEIYTSPMFRDEKRGYKRAKQEDRQAIEKLLGGGE